MLTKRISIPREREEKKKALHLSKFPKRISIPREREKENSPKFLSKFCFQNESQFLVQEKKKENSPYFKILLPKPISIPREREEKKENSPSLKILLPKRMSIPRARKLIRIEKNKRWRKIKEIEK